MTAAILTFAIDALGKQPGRVYDGSWSEWGARPDTPVVKGSYGRPATTRAIDGLFELAFRRHQAGELREAEQLYRDILEADPRQLDCLHFLGMIALQDGRPQEAVDLIGKAIAGNERIAAYHAGIAEAYGSACGKQENAIAHYRRAVAIEPGLWARSISFGTLLLDQAHHNDAARIRQEAVDAASWKDTEAGRTLFTCQCVRGAKSLPGDPAFRTLLTRALSDLWTRPVELAGAAVAVIRATTVSARDQAGDGVLAAPAVDRGNAARLIGVLAVDDLLRAVMDTTPGRQTRASSACSPAYAQSCSMPPSAPTATCRAR